jgi:nicotinate-nucleotide adenylyltransferase
MQIAVFGGTFDPPHTGHIALAQKAIEAGCADRILFVPAFIPPHKIGRSITDFRHRFAMLEIAIKDNENFLISDIEAERTGAPSFTLQTMKELSENDPENEYSLLIGSDSLRLLHTWHKGDELSDKWRLIVYPRPDEVPTLDELKQYWPPEKAEKLMDSLADLPFYDVSSTEIREKIMRNENTGDLLNPEVKCYIDRNKLYKQNNTEKINAGK